MRRRETGVSARRGPTAPTPLCVSACVHGPHKTPVSGLVIKMYYHPTVSREETNSLSACHSRLILILSFIHSTTPSLQGCGETADVGKSEASFFLFSFFFFYFSPGPHQTHNGGGKKRTVIANSINCRSLAMLRRRG